MRPSGQASAPSAEEILYQERELTEFSMVVPTIPSVSLLLIRKLSQNSPKLFLKESLSDKNSHQRKEKGENSHQNSPKLPPDGTLLLPGFFYIYLCLAFRRCSGCEFYFCLTAKPVRSRTCNLEASTSASRA